MKIHSIETGNFKLDGGSMFGVVPKSIWHKLYPVDEKNMCNYAMRCLLIEDGERKILVDTGMGDKQPEKFFKYYFPNGDYTLEDSLKSAGVNFDEITDLVFTHLHFDHSGGAAALNAEGEPELLFKNATVWIGKKQWESFLNPNAREKPSMFKENNEPLQQAKEFKLIEEDTFITENVKLKLVYGHTDGMIVPIINYGEKKVVYGADLLPTSANIHIPYLPSYDIRPLNTLEEKQELLKFCIDNDAYVIYEHDINIECSKVVLTEKGYRAGEIFKVKDI